MSAFNINKSGRIAVVRKLPFNAVYLRARRLKRAFVVDIFGKITAADIFDAAQKCLSEYPTGRV